ncbi:hypothetical protein [Kitasatospora sp. NPDC085464]|uniref:hypothetical protein n=1 Tax=Kitasatospora sp. NPDC085464 TaxID=3364063 RepID=UPI0037C87768
MTGIAAYDLVVPTSSLLITPRICPCGAELPSLAAGATPFRRHLPDPHADCYAQAQARLAEKVAADTDQAATQWQQLRQQHQDNPAAVAVLDLHRPEAGRHQPACSHCEQYDGLEGAEPAPWPCLTYQAVQHT